jgi:hypothetical protein
MARMSRPVPDRKPDPWESGAAGPFLWIEGSPVEVWALREDPFRITALGQQIVTGLERRDLARRSRSSSAPHALEVLLFDAFPRAIHTAQ